MQDHQREFLRFVLEVGVLRFGEFILKSGRHSPYFFNTGLLNSGARLARLGRAYAQTIQVAGLDCEMLYGPAYKGIPLVAATCMALADHHRLDLPYAFNRKEVKDHAEGGDIVGAPLQGRVLIVDDVISSGASVREAVAIIRAHGATPAGVVIALDRQEQGQDMRSAVAQIQADLGLSVTPIVRLEHLVEYLAERPDSAADLQRLRAYQQRYGAWDGSVRSSTPQRSPG